MKDFDKLLNEYNEISPLAEDLGSVLEHRLNDLMSEKALTLAVPCNNRIKKWDSIVGKIERKRLSLESLVDLNDLIGIRAIFLFWRDRQKAVEVIKETFEIISEEDTESRLQEKEFGYRSFHLIIKIPKEYCLNISDIKKIPFKAELQIRTMAQHIWASASHKLQYKYEDSAPIPIRRSIHRVSALLEVVDLEFERVLQEKKKYLESVDMMEDTSLNVDTLIRLLDDKIPQKYKGRMDQYADLLQDLRAFNVQTTEDLSVIIDKHMEIALIKDKTLIDTWSGRNDKFPDFLKNRMKRGVFLDHTGLVRAMMLEEFGDEWKSYIKQVISDRIFK